MNENGLRLLQLCALQDLSVMNTHFQLKEKYKNTWKHPRTSHWHMIDYIIVRSKNKIEVKKCRVMRSAACETDHRLIRANIQLKPRIFNQKKVITIKYDSGCLKNELMRKIFEETLSKNRPTLREDDVETNWNNMKSAITKTASEIMDKKKPKNSGLVQ